MPITMTTATGADCFDHHLNQKVEYCCILHVNEVKFWDAELIEHTVCSSQVSSFNHLLKLILWWQTADKEVGGDNEAYDTQHQHAHAQPAVYLQTHKDTVMGSVVCVKYILII